MFVVNELQYNHYKYSRSLRLNNSSTKSSNTCIDVSLAGRLRGRL